MNAMKIEELKTPAFLVDLPKLKTNLRNMQERARKHGIRLRPHVKTHKTAEIARLQTPDAACGITVSTLAEARFFQKAGFDDITYAFPISPGKLAEAAELTGRLKHQGIDCETVSVSSTPTAVHAPGWQGVSEIRPGNYAFFDKFQADIGSCRLEEAAATVLTTVVAHYAQHNQMLIDAGALALSKDPGAVHRDAEIVYGTVPGSPLLKIFSISQEHGLITSQAPIDFNNFTLGSLLQIIPNHSCLAAALFDRYHVIEGNRVVDEWRPMRGW